MTDTWNMPLPRPPRDWDGEEQVEVIELGSVVQ